MMTTADIAKFRRRVGDKVKSHTDTFTAQAGDTAFTLSFSNATNIVVTVNGATKMPVYDDEEHTITFSPALSANDAVVATYDFSAYTDAEIEALVAEQGFNGGVIEILAELMTDSARLYDYSEGATEAKLSQIFDHLKELLEFYEKKQADEDGGYTGDDGTKLGHLKFGKRISPYYMDNRRKEYKDLTRDPLI